MTNYTNISKPIQPTGYGAMQWQEMTIQWQVATKDWREIAGGYTSIPKPN